MATSVRKNSSANYHLFDDGLDVLEVGAVGVEHGAEKGDVDDLQVEPDSIRDSVSVLGVAVAFVFTVFLVFHKIGMIFQSWGRYFEIVS